MSQANARTQQFKSRETSSPGIYGHIHGRRFTATTPGLYIVGFRIIDTSSNGTGGGPIHSPSDVFPMYLQSGVTIASISKKTNAVTVTFGTQSGNSYFLVATTNLASTNWTAIGGPLAGDNHLQSLVDTSATALERYYRLRVETP